MPIPQRRGHAATRVGVRRVELGQIAVHGVAHVGGHEEPKQRASDPWRSVTATPTRRDRARPASGPRADVTRATRAVRQIRFSRSAAPFRRARASGHRSTTRRSLFSSSRRSVTYTAARATDAVIVLAREDYERVLSLPAASSTSCGILQRRRSSQPGNHRRTHLTGGANIRVATSTSSRSPARMVGGAIAARRLRPHIRQVDNWLRDGADRIHSANGSSLSSSNPGTPSRPSTSDDTPRSRHWPRRAECLFG